MSINGIVANSHKKSGQFREESARFYEDVSYCAEKVIASVSVIVE